MMSPKDTSAPFPAPGPQHRDIVLYDTTLRDGMQREGMSVSVDEKIRIAKRLASLGIHVIEAGFPGSQPEGRRVVPADGVVGPGRGARERVRHDPGPGSGGRCRPGDAHPGRELGAGGLHRGQDVGSPRREGAQSRSGREPAHDRRVGGLPVRSRQGRGLRRRALLRRLRRPPRLRPGVRACGGGGRGGHRSALRHQRGHTAAPPGRHRGRGGG